MDKNTKPQQVDLNEIILSVEESKWRHLNLGLNLNLGRYCTLDLSRSLIPVSTGRFDLQTSNMEQQFLNALIHKAAIACKRFTVEIFPWSHEFATLVNLKHDIKQSMIRGLSQSNIN